MKLRQPELKRARIEIVPMIDTIFFLLVFFMITSLSMVTLKSRHVTLPDSETAKIRPQEQVVVTAASDGTYYVDKAIVTEKQILPTLNRRIISNPKIAVVLNCDKSLPVSHFLRLFDLAKQANAGNVMIATMPRTVSSGAK